MAATADAPRSTYVPGTLLPAFTPLHDGWSLRVTSGPVPEPVAGRDVPARVPGSAHTALLDAGLIPDPYLDTHEADLVWMHRTSWRWDTTFHAGAVAADERVDLVLRGLETVATVRLNGRVVAETANQHRSYRADVTDLLVDGANHLTVDLRSTLEHAEEVERRLGERARAYPHPFNAVRTMACAFGWDWGPDLQPSGIWQPIGLERWRTARLAQVRPLVTVDDSTGHVAVHVHVERADDEAPLTVRARVAGRGADRSAEVSLEPGAVDAVVVLDVPDVDLWWPRGHGAQPLYDLTVELEGPGGALGRVDRRIGFRTVEVDTTPDEHGTPFTIRVNGRPVYVKGANWIPDDILLTRMDRDRYARRVAQATGANINLLRVWGGGIYEAEDFYDACDEAGVMVWQDFLFACAAYSEDEPLAGEVAAEAREHVARLTSHASLVLWNGANENMWGFVDWDWPEGADRISWGLGYYTRVLPEIVAALDPTRPYSTNSPYSPGFGVDDKHPNDPDHGTHHQWECWNERDFVRYRQDVPRFCSEFGWQATPTWATLSRALPADGLAKDSPAFLLHEKAPDGVGKLDRGIAAHLPVPEDFADWAWATQVIQARAVRFAVEHYRSWWPRSAGAIVWQLNDCWPVTSWAAVDSDERVKPLWHTLRQVYADRLLTVQPRGVGDDECLVVAVVNDTDEAWETSLAARRTTLAGEVLAEASLPAEVAPRSVVTVPLPDDVALPGDRTREVLVVRTADGGTAEADDVPPGTVHLWAEDKDVAYEAAPLDVTLVRSGDGYRVTVGATSLTRDLALLADVLDPGAQVDRGMVTLAAGETVTFTVRSTAVLSEADVADRRVLRSVNGLVAGPVEARPGEA